jgi:hypothetical protein
MSHFVIFLCYLDQVLHSSNLENVCPSKQYALLWLKEVKLSLQPNILW